MQLLVILALVASLAFAEPRSSGAVPHADGKMLAAVFAMAFVVIMAWALSLATVWRMRQDWSSLESGLQSFSRWQSWHGLLWLVVTVGIVVLLDWPQMVLHAGHPNRVFWDELTLLIPAIAPLLLSWAAFSVVEKTIRSHIGMPPNNIICAQFRYVWTRARHLLALPLIPLVVFLTARDVMQFAAPHFNETVIAGVLYLVLLVLLGICFPGIIRRMWNTKSLESGILRLRLENAAERFGLRMHDILIWKTDGRIVNAAITGFVPRYRYVLLSDALLDRLSAHEVEAVFAHEAAHIRQCHPHRLLLAVMLPVGLCIGTSANANAPSASNVTLWTTGIILYLVFGLGWLAKRLEYHADLWACWGLGDQESTELVLAKSSTDRFINALIRVAGETDEDRRRRDWLHPSVNQRIHFLQSVLGNPELGIRFCRSINCATWTMAGAAVLAVLLTRWIGL